MLYYAMLCYAILYYTTLCISHSSMHLRLGDTLAPAAGYTGGGTLRDSGWDTLGPAARYIGGGTLRD